MTDAGPVVYAVEDGILRITARGVYPLTTYLECFGAAVDDPDSPDPALILSDSRESAVERTAADMRRVAEYVVGFGDRVRAVAVVAPRDTQFGLTRIAASLASQRGADIGAFRSVEDAEAWLRDKEPT